MNNLKDLKSSIELKFIAKILNNEAQSCCFPPSVLRGPLGRVLGVRLLRMDRADVIFRGSFVLQAVAAHEGYMVLPGHKEKNGSNKK